LSALQAKVRVAFGVPADRLCEHEDAWDAASLSGC
jgi:hypothetical protein